MSLLRFKKELALHSILYQYYITVCSSILMNCILNYSHHNDNYAGIISDNKISIVEITFLKSVKCYISVDLIPKAIVKK